MTPGEFCRRRARIEGRENKSTRWRKAAMRHLIDDANAQAVVVSHKTVGWRMSDGHVVCRKQRYRTQADAELSLMLIGAYGHGRVLPKRAYYCSACGGWHLTHRD